jgi:hypothetical protein
MLLTLKKIVPRIDPLTWIDPTEAIRRNCGEEVGQWNPYNVRLGRSRHFDVVDVET